MADGCRILVAEEARDVRLLIGCFLDSPAFRLDMVENGQQALERFKQHAYDLVLMDMQMPVMDGYTATREIRAWEKEQGRSPIPVLAASAIETTEEVDRCLDAGCTAHVRKPFLKPLLLDVLGRYLISPATLYVAGLIIIDPLFWLEVSGGIEEVMTMSEQQDRIIVHVDPDLEPIVPRFFELRHENLQAISAGLAAEDFTALAWIGHSMKGSGAGYGFDYITELGRSIEQAAKAQDADGISANAAQLAAYLQRVEVVFDG